MAAAFVDRDYAQVVAISREAEALGLPASFGLGWRFQGHYHMGEFEAALTAARQLGRLYPGPESKSFEALALARLGDVEQARRLLAELEADSTHRHVDPYRLAWVHLVLGNKAAAFDKLREACALRSELVVFPDLGGGLRTDPKLDELRDEPEFQELLKLARLDVWPIPALKQANGM